MKKRQFIAASTLATALPLHVLAATDPRERKGAGLLTVAGAVAHGNRGPLDPALDQLMAKHGARFDKAWEFDAAMLERLPSVTIEPTLEYDARVHRLSGPLLDSVLEAAGVATDAPAMLSLRALDGYTVTLSLADARSHRMIVATAMDKTPMSVGGLGPLWAVYDADRLPAFRNKPLNERFALCPWGLYYVEVTAL